MSEKKFCAKCEYYYSEMFTCPICYGEQKAEQRILEFIDRLEHKSTTHSENCTSGHYLAEDLRVLIKGEIE